MKQLARKSSQAEIHLLSPQEFWCLNNSRQLLYFWGPETSDRNGEFLVEIVGAGTDYNPHVFLEYVEQVHPEKWVEFTKQFGRDDLCPDLAEACYEYQDEYSDDHGIAGFDLFQAKYIYSKFTEVIEFAVKELGLEDSPDLENIYSTLDDSYTEGCIEHIKQNDLLALSAFE